jgi:antitoxin component YwqK of YwqJK toxin-antitoxin module
MKKYILLLLATSLFSCTNSEVIEKWENGNTKIETYQVDRSRNFEVHYYESGKKKEEGYTSGGEKILDWKGWHENGKLKYEMLYREGKSFSDYIKYHKNGNVKESGSYDESGLLVKR